MDYKKLAQKHLEEALTNGFITLANGDIRELKANEILSVARYVLKEGLLPESNLAPTSSNSPSEMFTDKEDELEDKDESTISNSDTSLFTNLANDSPSIYTQRNLSKFLDTYAKGFETNLNDKESS